MSETYRCPYPDCREVFDDAGAVPGRVVRCPLCGRPMNARPLSMEQTLRERAAAAVGGTGAAIGRKPLVALLDNVRSLWNVGSMFRTADACGVAELTLAGITGSPPRDAISKTALGAEQAVAWRYRAEALDALRELRGEGWVPVALETGAAGVALPDLEWPERTCLVVGNENRGVSPEVLAACPLRVSIPMCGVKDSLNVAVAFGIAVYAAAAVLERRASGS
jgi:tRNA G18 (ribose-2'-O)-methylase SpoU